MKKSRIISAITSIIVLIVSLTACAPSNNSIVAEPSGDKAGDKSLQITLKQFKQAYDRYLLDNNIDITQSAYQSSENTYKKAALDNLVDTTMLKHIINAEGLNELDEQTNKEMSEYIQSQVDELKESFKTTAKANDSLLEGEELQKQADKLYKDMLKSYNYTEEDLMDSIKYTFQLRLLIDKVTEVFDYTIEDAVKYAKDMYIDYPSVYEGMTYGEELQQLYLPDSARMVKHILIGLSDEDKQKIAAYRANGNDEDADKYRDEKLKTILKKSEEVLAKVNAMESPDEFSDLMQEYSQDPGKTTNPDGYLLFEGMTQFITEFYTAGIELKNVSDVTGLVASDYGYHILQYSSKVVIKDEDLQKLDVKNTLFYNTKIQEELEIVYTKWLEDYDYQVYYDIAGIVVEGSSSSN